MMNSIQKSLHQTVLLICLFFATPLLLNGQISLLNGTIQFPKNSQIVEPNLYYYGKSLDIQKHNFTAPKITYEIIKNKDQSVFYLLICPTAPTYTLKKFPQQDDMQNTIEELKLTPETPYLFYKLEQITTTTESGTTYQWEVTPESLPESGAIPETTILMIYFPHLIKSVSGGSQLELPTIHLDTIMDLTESLSAEEELIKLQLSSLDLSALHAPTKKKIKSDKRRVLVMETVV